MEQIALYKEFRIRAYQDWSGQWLAEAKKPFDTNAEYIATASAHPTPEEFKRCFNARSGSLAAD